METKTFKTIFTAGNNSTCKNVEIKKIEIPKIQRDYAYGRTDKKNERKRNNFIDSLYDAVNGKPITLDFIYGDIKQNILTPLDGQQRLTTLFLLYWYASKKEQVAESETSFLKCFSYETRPSARQFCEIITTKSIEFEAGKTLSELIKDQNWFPLEWQHDATVSSMLVMLDAIQEKFSQVEDLYAKLENISFYFLPIENMGLTDDLYIKMNSRGKPLTPFEHFKAEFEKQLILADQKLAKRIGAKIDREWTDLLWDYRNSGVGDDSDNTTDDEFLRYFIFICNIICYKNGGSPKTSDEFDLLKEFFTIQGNNDKEKVIENAKILESFFDCWLEDKKSIPIKDFFESFASKEHSVGKIKTNYNVNFLEDCFRNYADIIGKNRRRFTLNQIILLYTFVLYRQNISVVSEEDFRRRLRVINNLILNSSDQISDSENRQGGNRLPAILNQVDSIILKGIIADTDAVGGINFSPTQLEEERLKLEWTAKNPDKAESLFALEDNELLYGQITVVGLEQPDNFERFESLFKCNWDLVNCALFTVGDYKQKERNGRRYQLGSSMSDGYAWKTLFHRSENLSGFENTQKVLNELLSRESVFTDDCLNQMVKDYLDECENKQEYSWIYYFIKYKLFRPDRYGKYWWNDSKNSPYVFTALFQRHKVSEKSYNPFLKEVNGHVSREHWGNRIYINDGEFLTETQTSYLLISNDENENVKQEFAIAQNEKGIDTENRIEKMKENLSTLDNSNL